MNLLDRILENKRWEISKRKKNYPQSFLEKQKRHSSHSSLNDALSVTNFSLICEFKRMSPSEGNLNPEANPIDTVIQYTDLGATAISVLTDQKFFNGSLRDLAQIKKATHLPVLRKDFIIDEYQLTESWMAGADAVLLIADILDLATLTHFYRKAKDIGLDALVELHDEKHAFKLTTFEPDIIGINCRNLNTMKTDLSHFEKMRSHLPENAVYIAESGISSKKDIEFVSGLGYNAALIGTSIMQDPDHLKALLI